MTNSKRPETPEYASNDPPGAQALSWSATAAALGGLAAAWIAAGAVGLMSHPLRHTLTWLALAVAALADRPHGRRSPWQWLILLGAALGAVIMTASGELPINVLGVALLLAAVALDRSGPARRVLLLPALGAAVLGVYRLALGIGTFWTLADRIGGGLGRFAGTLVGRPLWVGATFGGLDFLVVMAVVCVGWALGRSAPRRTRDVAAGLAILAGHVVYLLVIAFAADLKAALPAAQPEKGFTLANMAQSALPWNLPAIAALIHLAVAGVMFRWSSWPGDEQQPAAPSPAGRGWMGTAAWAAVVGLAVLLPVVTSLSVAPCSLAGKKVVANEKGFLNWLRPRHEQFGRLSIGMYGMMPVFFESLGAKLNVSPDLSKNDLDAADLLIVIYPDEPWKEGVRERIIQFVRDGGSLLVLGEHTVRGKDGGCRFNELLEVTDMQVRFDSATFAVGGWLHSYQALAHPAAAGIGDERNQFGAVIGASVSADWPAVPLLVGRWGWADPGEEGGSAQMGNHEYDPGEKLGDIVLAAEQPCGGGRIIAFGDTSGFTNGITVGSHAYTSRLYGYLASKAASPQAVWRQLLGMLLAAGLVGVLCWRRDASLVGIAAVALAASLALCTKAVHDAAEALPDGRKKKPNNLAYIDTTHMEAQSPESWRPDGLAGLGLNLMRNGYLTLNLPEFTRERLERAGLVVSIAPDREFTKAEREIVRDFVSGGGIFLCTVGYDRAGPSRSLLKDFGFHASNAPPGPDGKLPEPQPMGHFKVPYLQSGTARAYVRYHASWPITSTEPDARIIAYGQRKNGKDTKVILSRQFGKGKFVVVGDTCFAMNKNLERRDGLPIEGKRENIEFWRWFLSVLRDQPMWSPLPTTTAPAATAPAKTAPGGKEVSR